MGKYLRKAAAGLIISLVISLFIINIFNIPLGEVLAIPPALLIPSILLILVRIMAQGLRLHLLLIKFSEIRIGLTRALILRGASEFFALTALPFLADEAARTWLLTKRGENMWRAFWLSFTEMILDTFVGGLIAFVSGVYALIQHIYYIAVPILIIATFQLVAVTVFTAAVKGGGMMDVVRRLTPRLPLPREIREGLAHGRADVISSLMSRSNAPLLSLLLLATLAVMFTPAVVLYLILSDGHTFLEFLYAFHSGNVLGLLPITVGGAGLTEAGVYLYLSGVLGLDSMAAVLRWRITTYHIPLIIAGVMLIPAILQRRGADLKIH